MGNVQKESFLVGEKIKISLNHSWAKGATGVIAVPPDSVKEMFEEWTNDFWREMNTPRGNKRFYWIRLDVPCRDADGDGPYEEAEIERSYIERVF